MIKLAALVIVQLIIHAWLSISCSIMIEVWSWLHYPFMLKSNRYFIVRILIVARYCAGPVCYSYLPWLVPSVFRICANSFSRWRNRKQVHIKIYWALISFLLLLFTLYLSIAFIFLFRWSHTVIKRIHRSCLVFGTYSTTMSSSLHSKITAATPKLLWPKRRRMISILNQTTKKATTRNSL